MTGVMLLDKAAGMTSFRAAAQLRRVCGEKKIGHTGTLDPMATGLLPVLLGGATKFADLLPDHDKAYRATFLLGAETDTLDITGRVVRQRYVAAREADVRQALTSFCGRITQIPPMYSAVSQGGVRLYALARQGLEVERKPRQVEIYSLELTDADDVKGAYTIDVSCSAGTYIRTLVSDVGALLGCGAVLTALRRIRACGFCVEQAHSPEYLSACSAEALADCLLPIDTALAAYPAVTVTQNQSVRFRNGGALDLARVRIASQGKLYRVYDPQGAFLGLGERDDEKNELAVRRLLIER